MRGFVDRNGRRVGDYSQRRQTASWTGEPRRRRPAGGPKLTKGGAAKNVAQTFVVPRTRRGLAKQQRRRDWQAREERDRSPGQLAIAAAVTAPAGLLVVATSTGFLVVVGVFVAAFGALFGAVSLALRIGAASRR